MTITISNFDSTPKCTHRNDNRCAYGNRRRKYNSLQFHIIKTIQQLVSPFPQTILSQCGTGQLHRAIILCESAQSG
jgi:hypothetical protein